MASPLPKQRNTRLASSVLSRSRDLNASDGAVPLFPMQYPADSSAIAEESVATIKVNDSASVFADPYNAEPSARKEPTESPAHKEPAESSAPAPANRAMSYAHVAKEAASLPDEVEPSGYQKLVDSSAQSIAPIVAALPPVPAPVKKLAAKVDKPKSLSEHQRKKREDRRLAFEAKKAAEQAEQIVDGEDNDFEVVTHKKKSQPVEIATPKIAWGKPDAPASEPKKAPTPTPVPAAAAAPMAMAMATPMTTPEAKKDAAKPHKKSHQYGSDVHRVDKGQAEIVCANQTVQIQFEIKYYANKWTVEFNYRGAAITVNGGKIAHKADPHLDFDEIAAKIRSGIVC